MKYKILTILFLGLFLNSCECPTKIETDRIIKPDNSANAMFINSSDFEELDVFSSDVKVLDDYKYQNSVYRYYKVQAGVDLLKISTSDNKKSLINIPVDFKKNAFYTIVIYSLQNISNFILLKDDYTIEPSKACVRIINSSNKYASLNFSFSKNDVELISLPLNKFTSTDFISISPDKYTLNVINAEDNQVIYKIDNFDISKENAYSLVFRTNSNINDIVKIEHKQN